MGNLIMSLYKISRPLLFKIEPEKSHHLIGSLLSLPHTSGFFNSLIKPGFKVKSNPVTIAGIHFDNPIGIAAGFDKNAHYYNGLASIGAGFVEIGSLTRHPQEGNPKPRVKRLIEDQAIINRMGLNNDGVDEIKKNLEKNPPKIPIGISIAPNHGLTTEQMIEDMSYCTNLIQSNADYISLNLSCPNQDGVTTLQEPDTVLRLLDKIEIKKPVFCKFSVDISDEQLFSCLDALSGKVAGIILSNTSIKREGLTSPNKDFKGGLSGKPLFERVLHQMNVSKEKYGNEFAFIFSGGVFAPEDAKKAIAAGADLIQVFTGMIYEGPGIFKRINKEI